jgi:hypothetical protein
MMKIDRKLTLKIDAKIESKMMIQIDGKIFKIYHYPIVQEIYSRPNLSDGNVFIISLLMVLNLIF